MSSTQTTTKHGVRPSEATFKARTGMGRFFAGDDASAVYEAAERLTGPVATPLVEHAGLTKNITQPIHVLDMACGTGVVSAHLHQALSKMSPEAQDKVQLTCADISESQIGYVRQRIQAQGWKNTVAVQTNAEVINLICLIFWGTILIKFLKNTTLPDNAYDVIMIGMALMLIPDPRSTIKGKYLHMYYRPKDLLRLVHRMLAHAQTLRDICHLNVAH